MELKCLYKHNIRFLLNLILVALFLEACSQLTEPGHGSDIGMIMSEWKNDQYNNLPGQLVGADLGQHWLNCINIHENIEHN